MKVNIHKFYQNREAVIKGAALFLLDIILTIACMVGALWMRFDFSFSNIEPEFWHSVRANVDQCDLYGADQCGLQALHESVEVCQH